MIKVDVILVTYNHEKYVKQAVESIFLQYIAPDVKLRLIVADDSSTDSTLNIAKSIIIGKEVEVEYMPVDANVGMVKNYQRAFAACKGDYVFILEGDDMWTSLLHIEQHIRYLENHLECSMSMNRYAIFFQNSQEFEYEDNEQHEITYYNLSQQIIDINHLGNLSACCFRGKYIGSLPPKIFELYFADWLLGMVMAQHGLICVFRECTSLYRISSQGLWSGIDRKAQKDFLLKAVKEYDAFFDFKYHQYFMMLEEKIFDQNIVRRLICKISNKSHAVVKKILSNKKQ